MKKLMIGELYKNRLLNTKEELMNFEEGLNVIVEMLQEEDIPDLCRVFDDNTKDDEVMFGLIHLIELFSSEKAFVYTVLGIANMMVTAPNWAKIIIYRCLNDDFSRSMLKNAITLVEPQVQQLIISLLNGIKREDSEKFGADIDKVLY